MGLFSSISWSMMAAKLRVRLRRPVDSAVQNAFRAIEKYGPGYTAENITGRMRSYKIPSEVILSAARNIIAQRQDTIIMSLYDSISGKKFDGGEFITLIYQRGVSADFEDALVFAGYPSPARKASAIFINVLGHLAAAAV